MSDFLNPDEWIALNERLKERRIKSGIPPSQEFTPTNQPQASDEAQRKKDWDEWMALNERLKERRIQSGIAPAEEVTIQEAVKPQNIPAIVVQNSVPRLQTVQKPREVKILTPIESFAKWLDWRITENKMCVGCHWLPAGPLGNALAQHTVGLIGLSVQIADMIELRGFCVEPDARFGIGSYEWLQTLALFKASDGDWMQPSTAYLDAANLLRLCILIANADGRIDTVELDVFRRAIENQIGLSQTDHRRLIILEQLLAQELSTSSDYAIAKIIKSIPADKRLTTGKLLVEVATTENVITKEQRRILERIFKAFEIPSDTLEKLIGQACLRPRYDAVQDISNRPSRKWTLKDWRDGHAGVLIDDFTISHKRWNFTDWKTLNARWRALHEQLNTQQKQFANSPNEIKKATPRENKKLRPGYGKPCRTNLSKLTEETIRAETKTGDTRLHRAATIGRIYDMPSDLLKAELFMATNHVGRTPVHFAAKYGHLDKIPPEFLTKESVTVFDKYGETPLHTAAYHKHADQIPANFLTLEFLGIHTKHHTAWTVLYLMAFSGQLKLLPAPIIERYNSMSRLEKGGLDYDMPKRHEIKEDRIPLFVRSLVFYREQVCPHFTIGRATKAAKELDAIAPGWRDDENRDKILLRKAAELNPEWAEKERWV